MEDVGDPNYQYYALRFTDAISTRYANHPALLAFGIDNESGDGRISYSETARQRFIAWLKAKYSNLENLNKAWATQRWSRKLNQLKKLDFRWLPIQPMCPNECLISVALFLMR